MDVADELGEERFTQPAVVEQAPIFTLILLNYTDNLRKLPNQLVTLTCIIPNATGCGQTYPALTESSV